MNTDINAAKIFKTLDGATFFEIGLILAAATLLIFSVQRVLPWIANRLHGQMRLTVLAVVPVLRLLIVIGAVALVVPLVINPSMQNMVALLGTVGVALGFALKDYASSLIAGVVAVGEKPYRNGDWIQIDGHYGEVRHVGMRTVEIVTPDDSLVTIPHSKLWTDPIVNANDGGPRLMCVADFYLHPAHDAVAVRAVLKDVALTSPYLRLDSPTFVIVLEKPWGTHYRLKGYPLDARQQFRFISDLTVRGKAALGALGVRFAVAATQASAGG